MGSSARASCGEVCGASWVMSRRTRHFCSRRGCGVAGCGVHVCPCYVAKIAFTRSPPSPPRAFITPFPLLGMPRCETPGIVYASRDATKPMQTSHHSRQRASALRSKAASGKGGFSRKDPRFATSLGRKLRLLLAAYVHCLASDGDLLIADMCSATPEVKFCRGPAGQP